MRIVPFEPYLKQENGIMRESATGSIVNQKSEWIHLTIQRRPATLFLRLFDW